jgi:hypothetical protein
MRYSPVDGSAMETQAEIKRMAESIYRDKVLRARMEDPIQKLLDGFALFTAGVAMTRMNIIDRIAVSDEAAVQEGLRRRFERVRQIEEAGLYRRR